VTKSHGVQLLKTTFQNGPAENLKVKLVLRKVIEDIDGGV
jgi:hypothetical protein